MRQMILAIKNKEGEQLFTSVDLSWNHSGYTLFWPRKYDEEGLTAVSNLSATLHHTHGDCVKKLLSDEEIQKINNTEWRNGVPYTKDEEELDDLLQDSEDLTWFDLSLLKEDDTEDNTTKSNNT